MIGGPNELLSVTVTPPATVSSSGMTGEAPLEYCGTQKYRTCADVVGAAAKKQAAVTRAAILHLPADDVAAERKEMLSVRMVGLANSVVFWFRFAHRAHAPSPGFQALAA